MTPRRAMFAKLLARCGVGLLALGLASGASFAANDVPFAISVDGEEVTGSVMPKPGASDGVRIDVKFDGLGANPLLNVATVPMRASFRVGETVGFRASFNYGEWIARGEILIRARGARASDDPYAVIAIDDTGHASWTMTAEAPAELSYVLRVYDDEGRFDETEPVPLSRREGALEPHEFEARAPAPGYATDRTAIRNIAVHGGAITVHGRHVPQGHEVFVMNERVDVDGEGSFVVQRLMPAGKHIVDVRVVSEGEGLDFSSSVEIPESEWFYVGLADLTAGYNFGDHMEEVRPGDFDKDVFARGRLAFYLKGKIKGRYILTAAADTGEARLKEIFRGLDGKDPRQFLSRLDPDDYYPVYGDDSTGVEDAPTRGKFYVRLDKGPSHVMWGNFKANISGSTFIRTERALYGAKAAYRSQKSAPDGGAALALDAHAAIPGTIPQRDVFRGTGGSAYFAKHQDVTPGSDTVTIEVRNAITGWVIERRVLAYGRDYDFDYMQGVVILRQPLPSSSGFGTENFLVLAYEFAPAAGDAEGYVLGGRAHGWLGDHVRVGVTAQREKTEGSNQRLVGADLHVRASPGTFVTGEVARSQGPGFGSTYSADGGLTLQTNASAGVPNRTADAYRVEGRLDLGDVSENAKGKIAARYEHYGKGFSSLDVEAKDAKRLMGAEADIKIASGTSITVSASDEKVADGSHTTQAFGKVNQLMTESVSLEPYGIFTRKQASAAAPSTEEHGKRTDAGVKLLYAWDDGNKAYVFGQGTASRTGTMHKDHRAGVGGHVKLMDRVTLDGEVSNGSLGIGAAVTLGYEPNADDRYYLGYKLDPARDLAENWPFELVGEDMGTIVAGARHRFNEHWLAYAEDNFDAFGEHLSLTQVYGVTFTPDAAWTVTGGMEVGQVFDDTIDPVTLAKNPDFDRIALSMAVGYSNGEGLEGKLKGEARFDDSEDDDRDMAAYLLQASLGIKLSQDWRALASFDGVFTEATDSTREGDYAEGSVGFAYRPAVDDRLVALLKYTFLHDRPGADQVGIDGTEESPSQRSHIASADVSYDIVPALTLGAKYGVRLGQTREREVGAEWVDSQVHLGIVRADLHIVHEFDALLEGRIMWSPATRETDFGLVAALYRHFGSGMKVGVGYNFGHFSDDLRDLVHDDHGVFVNFIAKF